MKGQKRFIGLIKQKQAQSFLKLILLRPLTNLSPPPLPPPIVFFSLILFLYFFFSLFRSIIFCIKSYWHIQYTLLSFRLYFITHLSFITLGGLAPKASESHRLGLPILISSVFPSPRILPRETWKLVFKVEGIVWRDNRKVEILLVIQAISYIQQ